MRLRLLVGLSVLALIVVACDSGDAELTPGSTLVTGGGSDVTTTTAPEPGTTAPAPSTTLVGQAVDGFEVVNEIPNDDGVEQHIVIPNGAYTDVDLQNFLFDLLDSNPDLYGSEIFDDADAATAFLTPSDERTEDEQALLERHHFLTLTGRDSYEFNGPFAEFSGGAIGS